MARLVGVTNEDLAVRERKREGVVERARARRARSEANVRLIPARARNQHPAAIVCLDCGCEIKREPSCFVCECGVGFTAQWDVSLGAGVYLGRIIRPEEVAA